MWVLRWVLIALIILVVLFFSMQNSQDIDVKLLNWQGSVPFYLVVFFSFAAGMVSFLIVAFYHQLRHQLQIRKHRKEIKDLKNEIENVHIDNREMISDLQKKIDELSSKMIHENQKTESVDSTPKLLDKSEVSEMN